MRNNIIGELIRRSFGVELGGEQVHAISTFHGGNELHVGVGDVISGSGEEDLTKTRVLDEGFGGDNFTMPVEGGGAGGEPVEDFSWSFAEHAAGFGVGSPVQGHH